MSLSIYKINLLTNMHVGSGDMKFDLIDKQVQKDVLTSYPIINSSSLKGALKRYFENDAIIKELFGDENAEGKATFFSANLLSFPVRSNKQAFFRAICPDIIDSLLTFIDDFSLKSELNDVLKEVIIHVKNNEATIFNNDKGMIFENIENVIIEDYRTEYSKFDKPEILESLFGSDLVLFSNDIFKSIVSDLPVIARNNLTEKNNLWYEEIVPRETKFYFAVLFDKLMSCDIIKDFDEKITETPVQIGGNSSIGYGFSKIERVNIAGGIDE